MKYCDRTGKRWEDSSRQDRLLAWVYSHKASRAVMKCMTTPWISKMGGYMLGSSFSKLLIAPFVKSNHIDLSLYESRRYTSYNDFFTRQIKKECRPVSMESAELISPCDGKLSVYPINEDSVFHIKHSAYTIESLTRSRKIASKYKGGWCVLIRLTVDDYHRYCYVDDGLKTKNYRIPGCFYTVNPAAVEAVPVYKENSREFTMIHSRNFGDIIQMEVGALLVGKIVNHHEEAMVVRGHEKGYFEFGGSTVILLLDGKRVHIAEDLCKNTADGYETKVSMGEVIGTALESYRCTF